MAPGAIKIAVVALTALAGLGVAACSSILGIQDRTLDPAAGDGGGSSSGGEGGSSCVYPCAMASNLNHPFAMTVDEANVYWTEYGDETDTNGSIKACPVAGCGAGPLVYATFQASPRGITVDGQNVYWGTAPGATGTGAIWSCAIGGCNSKPTMVATADTPFGVALDSTYVYWTEYNLGTVNRAPKSGGSVALLSDGGLDMGNPNGPKNLVLDTGFVYFNDQNDTVFRVALGGGALVPMYADPNNLVGGFGLAVDSQDVYIGSAPGIYEMSKTATSGATMLVPNVTDVSNLWVDPAGAGLYWSDFGMAASDGTVGMVPLDGGAPVVIHQGLVTPESIGTNSTSVFWTSNGALMADGITVAPNTGTLYRVAK